MPDIIPTPSNPPRSIKPPEVKAQVIRRRALGESMSAIADVLGITVATVSRIIAESQTETREVRSIESIFAAAGLTPASVAESYARLSQANDIRLATFEGKFTDRVEVPDENIRHKAIADVAKILNLFPKEESGPVAALFVRLPDRTMT